MATYKARGTSHCVIYRYRDEDGQKKQIWETYTTQAEAMKRKAYIDYLEQHNLPGDLLRAVQEYKRIKAVAKAVYEECRTIEVEKRSEQTSEGDNTGKTYREFVEKWLPFHARKKRFSPNSIDSYQQNLDNHILPYFGDRVMSTITSEDVDDFLDYLSMKPCTGSRSYGKMPDEIPTLSTASIKKCYTVLTSGFATAKKWRYITEIPETTPPTERTAKRHAWLAEKVYAFLESIKDDKLLHLIVHLAFVCSLRAGETVGIDLSTVDLQDASLWITRQVQRVSDKALAALPDTEIIQVFPKQINTAKSSLILKRPKTEGSLRKQYLTTPLLNEIRERMRDIAIQKEFFHDQYHDYGLLICHPDGRPIDPKSLSKLLKERQKAFGIAEDDLIEFHGLRKSGQMHKVRLTQNNYQLVAESSGQSPEVLMNHYNEALDSEKRALARLVEDSFYPADLRSLAPQNNDLAAILSKLQQNPDMMQQLLQNLLLGAAQAS